MNYKNIESSKKVLIMGEMHGPSDQSIKFAAQAVASAGSRGSELLMLEGENSVDTSLLNRDMDSSDEAFNREIETIKAMHAREINKLQSLVKDQAKEIRSLKEENAKMHKLRGGSGVESTESKSHQTAQNKEADLRTSNNLGIGCLI